MATQTARRSKTKAFVERMLQALNAAPLTLMTRVGYAFSTVHCMTMSLALDGEGLGTAWGEQKAKELLAEAGLDHLDVRQVEGDMFNNYYVAARS